MLRGSFDQALWPQAFAVRVFKPAVCLHSHLLLGRSSLPFASLQMPKMLRGSFDQALWPQAFVVRAFKPALCLRQRTLRWSSSQCARHRRLKKHCAMSAWPPQTTYPCGNFSDTSSWIFLRPKGSIGSLASFHTCIRTQDPKQLPNMIKSSFLLSNPDRNAGRRHPGASPFY